MCTISYMCDWTSIAPSVSGHLGLKQNKTKVI